MKTSIGGDRLGSGNNKTLALRNYERSTHDLGYTWRSSMSSGTLVPFMSMVALPGDTFNIKLDCDVKTLPTLGPLFGSYKVQLDVFECPVRLYQGKLHMNMLNIGMDMGSIKLPQASLTTKGVDWTKGTNGQVHPSSIWKYLGISGVVGASSTVPAPITRKYNALPYLSYWDIYKQYYANKQEEVGVVIHSQEEEERFLATQAQFRVFETGGTEYYDTIIAGSITQQTLVLAQAPVTANSPAMELIIKVEQIEPENGGEPDMNRFNFSLSNVPNADPIVRNVNQLFNDVEVYPDSIEGNYTIIARSANPLYFGGANDVVEIEPITTTVQNTEEGLDREPKLQTFPLENIDQMRMDILAAVNQDTAFGIGENTAAPYGLSLGANNRAEEYITKNQEGLAIKTYQSDLFNNWISTEWIDGDNGINAITAVDTSEGEFTIDTLNLANKVYNMLNRIAISGGSYDDWLNAVYTHERAKSVENPVYHGSLIKELAFEEVVSTTDTEVEENQSPLGTLAGRGRLTGKHKGGSIKIKTNEHAYLIGLVSITPRIDYSQGNTFDMNLKTMNDFHKPALDNIGYQDLLTEQMAWWTTTTSAGVITEKSAGKQPAWINYMTNVNRTYGNFADENKEMFMTLNRRYEMSSSGTIRDLTTYVDPSKYNNIFAQSSRDSQNFWVQISNKIEARRKMSAKVIPNL